jgi:quinol monooxygenase YgiN
MTYLVVAHYHAEPEHADTVAGLVAELAAASRTEKDNLSYQVGRDLLDPAHFLIVETYNSAEGFEAHRESEHFQRIGMGRIIPLLASRVIERFVPAP